MKRILKALLWLLDYKPGAEGAIYRGTEIHIAWFAPMAIMAAAKLAGKGVQAWQQKKNADAANKQAEGQSQAEYESNLAREGNLEDMRLAKARGIIDRLAGGDRAISPAAVAALLKRKATETRKGVALKIPTHFGSNLLGSAIGTAGELASSYMKGLGGEDAPSGAAPTSLLSGGGIQSFAPKIGAGMFKRGNCPQGEIC